MNPAIDKVFRMAIILVIGGILFWLVTSRVDDSNQKQQDKTNEAIKFMQRGQGK